MFTPPAEVSAVLAAFALLFTEPSWLRAQALVCGTLLAPANHTLTAALRALGLGQAPGFQNYHRLLNRSPWSARQAAGVLLGLLVEAFVASGLVILGLDELLERRRGPKLKARAIHYDPVHSSKSCFAEKQRLTLDERSGVGPGQLGRPGLGAAVLNGPVPLGALRALPRAGPAAQAAGRARPGVVLAKCAGGCRGGPSSWWLTTTTPLWSY